jgi:hypothetical protein
MCVLGGRHRDLEQYLDEGVGGRITYRSRYEDVYWILLSQDSVKWWVLVAPVNLHRSLTNINA